MTDSDARMALGGDQTHARALELRYSTGILAALAAFGVSILVVGGLLIAAPQPKSSVKSSSCVKVATFRGIVYTRLDKVDRNDTVRVGSMELSGCSKQGFNQAFGPTSKTVEAWRIGKVSTSLLVGVKAKDGGYTVYVSTHVSQPQLERLLGRRH